MPEMDEGAFVLDYLAPAGTSLEDTDRQVRVIEAELRATPEIASYSRRTGLEMGFFVTDPNRGDIMVKLQPRAQRHRSMTEIMEDVHHRCEARLPGMTIEGVAPLADRVADIAGEPSPIEAKFFGDDPQVLAGLAERASEIISHVRGTTESIHEVTPSGPELIVRIDPTRAGRLGLTPQEVIQSLGAELFGRADTAALSGERSIPIRVLLPPSRRRTVDQVRGLPILARGQPVPLEAVADLSEVAGSYEVTRENQKPVIAATAGLEGRDLGSANAEVRARIRREIRLPPGYTVQYGGLYQTQQESFRSLLSVLLLGAFLVFIVMVFQYGRLAEPTALLGSGALALVGVVAALRATGTPFNASSFTGAIMIFGMVLTNGIVLMDVIRDRKAEGVALPEAILQAGALRLRPVMMTASIAVLTLLPLALGIGSGAEMQRPLAIAVIGGLLVSPFFTLLVAPTFLLLLDRQRAPGSPTSEERGL
jgi:Cu/Ag efflux pump CusA